LSAKLRNEQIERYEDAEDKHKKDQLKIKGDIDINKKHQNDLKLKLKKLKEEEDNFEKELIFQEEVQKKSKEV